MLSADQNERVTRTGPGTPAGALIRRYWQPAALTEELEGARPAVAVRLLGEDLVLYKDDKGGYGLVGRRCPHRGADLAYGRLEDGGLRCAFHGWLFDSGGRCLEQPAEPAGSRFHEKIRHTAYPCVERNGVVFAYLGPGEPPPLPAFDCFAAPESHAFAFKGYLECNWLQALEVGIDPAHASFLHRFFEDADPDEGYGLQFRDKADDSGLTVTEVLREYDRPELEVEETDFGLRIFALRELDADRMHVRVTNQLFPNAVVIPMSRDITITQWHVPIDDLNCYWYATFSSYAAPVDKATMREQRLQLYRLPDYRPRLNKSNNYGYDPDEQRSRTYTGMGLDINVHDQWAVESPGAIVDRSAEHLGSSDKAIIQYRRMLLAAMEELEAAGTVAKREAPSNPVAIDTVAPMHCWRSTWTEHDAAKRRASPWARA